MLTIGSLYGHGFDQAQRAALEALGFRLRPQASLYAGSQLCHFVDFPTGPALELIEVTDPADYDTFVPAGMVPYCPGISLVADGGPTALDAYERAFAALEPYRLHVPYDPDSQPGGPGWHYLNFARPVVPGTFIWLTSSDEPSPRPAREIRHPNGVRGVVGLLFDLPAHRLEDLSRLAGRPLAEAAVQVGNVSVAATSSGGAPGPFPLRSVVLEADDLDTFETSAAGAEETRLRGRPALRIATTPLAWDLIITTRGGDAVLDRAVAGTTPRAPKP